MSVVLDEIDEDEDPAPPFGMPSCPTCKRLRSGPRVNPTCDAFPNGIPDEIIVGLHDHRSKYKGDKGLLYDPDKQGEKFLALEEAQDDEDEDRSARARVSYQRAPFVPAGADETLPPLPERVEVTEADLLLAQDSWDDELPDYAGLLDAEVVDE